MRNVCVCACVCARVCVCTRACMCVRVRERETEREREREFCPLSGFRYTSTLRPVLVYRTEATRIGSLGITVAYRQPYSRGRCLGLVGPVSVHFIGLMVQPIK